MADAPTDKEREQVLSAIADLGGAATYSEIRAKRIELNQLDPDPALAVAVMYRTGELTMGAGMKLSPVEGEPKVDNDVVVRRIAMQRLCDIMGMLTKALLDDGPHTYVFIAAGVVKDALAYAGRDESDRMIERHGLNQARKIVNGVTPDEYRDITGSVLNEASFMITSRADRINVIEGDIAKLEAAAMKLAAEPWPDIKLDYELSAVWLKNSHSYQLFDPDGDVFVTLPRSLGEREMNAVVAEVRRVEQNAHRQGRVGLGQDLCRLIGAAPFDMLGSVAGAARELGEELSREVRSIEERVSDTESSVRDLDLRVER